MTELNVVRWRRFGKDRLYVNDGDGLRVGFLDLQTGERSCSRPHAAASMELALGRWSREHELEVMPLARVESSPLAESATSPAPTTQLGLTVAVHEPSKPREPADAPHMPRATPQLVDRVAGQAVMEHLLHQRLHQPQRSRGARVLGKSPLSTEDRPWFRGALGERQVGDLLARLDGRWRILHAVPVGSKGSDIDHVVIGPGGVFTVNTKNHAGQDVWVAGRTFMVNGHRQSYIPAAEYEAKRAAASLRSATGIPLVVTPVIAVVDPKKLTLRERPEKVRVLTSTQLVRWLRKRGPILSESDVERLASAAARPEVWSSQPLLAQDPAHVTAWFGRLQGEVRSASRVRVAWSLGAAAAAAAGVATAGPAVLEHVLSSLPSSIMR